MYVETVVQLGMVVAILAIASLATAATGDEQELVVHQRLDEATSRIGRLASKPYLDLIEANKGFYQSEVIIFKDVESGNEVWSLTREACTDLANIERRTAWSCDGKHISFIGNMAFLDINTGKIRRRRWAGYNYIANADGSKRRRLWAAADGRQRSFQDKFNNWDAKRPGVLYYPDKDQLWRVTLGESVTDNKAELIYTFPNADNKIIQEISDENFMLVEEMGEEPNCYVINLNRDPADKYFCLTYKLGGMIHPGSFRFKRSKRIVTGGYERGQSVKGSVRLTFKDEKALKPTTRGLRDPFTKNRRMGHLWYGAPDDRVGFFGSYEGKSGLYLQFPGKPAVMVAHVPDGHVTWCSHDPEWFFAAVGPGRGHYKDQQYVRKLLACNADGKTIKVICRPWDRSRGTDGGYDKYPRPNQSPDATKCWFHSDMLMPTNRLTGSYIAVFRRPYPPTELTVKTGPGVELEWKLHALSYEVKGCHVYRSEDAGKTFDEVSDRPVVGQSYKDTSAQCGKDYVYAVTCEEWSRLESDITSPTVTVSVDQSGKAEATATGKGVTGWDTTPPAKVSGFTATRDSDGMIKLSWKANTTGDLRYYNVYASSTSKPEAAQERLLVSPPHDETSYIDWTAPMDGPVHYAITAIDRQGNESSPASAEVK